MSHPVRKLTDMSDGLIPGDDGFSKMDWLLGRTPQQLEAKARASAMYHATLEEQRQLRAEREAMQTPPPVHPYYPPPQVLQPPSNFSGVTVRHTTAMPVKTRLFHYSMIGISAGLWLPFYRMAQRERGER